MTMELMMQDMVDYWYIWAGAVLFFGGIAFVMGAGAMYEKKDRKKSLFPMLCVELVFLVIFAMKVASWVKRGVSFWYVIFEYAPTVYISTIALLCIPIGYLLGMTFARKKA